MFADSEAKAECTPFKGTQSDTDSKGGVSQKFDCKAQVTLGLDVNGVEIVPNRPIYIDDGTGRKKYDGDVNFSKDAA